MSDIIFARTRFDYYHPEAGHGSYSDYWRMVELSGFPTCYVDELDTQDASKCYIFTPVNGELKSGDLMMGWPDAKARIIHWNIEQGCYEPIPGVAETWCSDALLAKECHARYVLMGSNKYLNPDCKPFGSGGHILKIENEKNFDFIALAYWTHRRQQVRDKLLERGLTFAPNAWGQERHTLLQHSRYMLHIHQNEGKPYVAPQRWCLAAAYRLPLISEYLGDRGLFTDGLFTEYMFDDLRFAVRRDDLNSRETGQALYEFLCVDHPFRREVERNV